ncbi:MAG: chemotaxis protein CheX [Deltaproteobacteria bacterium]|nr:chemotaxis protein CheX [Deltaproteobacteria bacterium]
MLENLKAAIFEVLETMFFLFPESLEEVGEESTGEALRAWVPVTGSRSYHAGLTVPMPLAQKMAANFLGCREEEVTSQEMEDIVREAANMVTGNFLSREQVPGAFRPEAPRSERIAGGAPRSPGHRLLFMVDDHLMEVFLERIA